MEHINFVILLLNLQIQPWCVASWWLRAGGNHVVKIGWYERTTYTVSCGFWKWGRCTKRKSVYHYRYECEEGWTYRYFIDGECNYAICDGKKNYDGACNIYYHNDYQIIRGQESSPKRSSGGSCTSPNLCTDCNDGFYSDGPYCRICGKISNCNHRRCTTSSNQRCFYCEGEVMPELYWRAYTPDTDDGKTCQKACSWRSDSTRCYPGVCTGGLASQCNCADNFGGTHCQIIQEPPNILMNHAVLTDQNRIFKLENNPNYVGDEVNTHWTNFVGYYRIETSMSAKYLQPADNRDTNHFVKDFRVGLIEQKMILEFYKGGNFHSLQQKLCTGMSRDQPVDHEECSHTFYVGYWPSLGHSDKLNQGQQRIACMCVWAQLWCVGTATMDIFAHFNV